VFGDFMKKIKEIFSVKAECGYKIIYCPSFTWHPKNNRRQLKNHFYQPLTSFMPIINLIISYF